MVLLWGCDPLDHKFRKFWYRMDWNIKAHFPEFSSIFGPICSKVSLGYNAIQWINRFPVDSIVCFANTYPLDSDLSGGQCYPPFEKPGHGGCPFPWKLGNSGNFPFHLAFAITFVSPAAGQSQATDLIINSIPSILFQLNCKLLQNTPQQKLFCIAIQNWIRSQSKHWHQKQRKLLQTTDSHSFCRLWLALNNCFGNSA